MKTGITMRELQKMSAGKIQALPHTMPIKNGRETVGLLVPLKKASKQEIDAVFAKIDAAAAKRTPEETKALARISHRE